MRYVRRNASRFDVILSIVSSHHLFASPPRRSSNPYPLSPASQRTGSVRRHGTSRPEAWPPSTTSHPRAQPRRRGAESHLPLRGDSIPCRYLQGVRKTLPPPRHLPPPPSTPRFDVPHSSLLPRRCQVWGAWIRPIHHSRRRRLRGQPQACHRLPRVCDVPRDSPHVLLPLHQ